MKDIGIYLKVLSIMILNHHFLKIILLIWEFFTPALTDGFSLEAEWQQVSSNLQDSF